jgi:hypothetical protein
MCLGNLFGKKPEQPQMPAPPPMPSPPPTPTAVESQTQAQDMATKRRLQMRAGLLSTIKTGGVFGAGAELSSVGSGKNTLG